MDTLPGLVAMARPSEGLMEAMASWAWAGRPSARNGCNYGPLEDSGGLPGYEATMDTLADPSHPDQAEHAAWVADMTGSNAPFDPAFLNIPP